MRLRIFHKHLGLRPRNQTGRPDPVALIAEPALSENIGKRFPAEPPGECRRKRRVGTVCRRFGQRGGAAVSAEMAEKAQSLLPCLFYTGPAQARGQICTRHAPVPEAAPCVPKAGSSSARAATSVSASLFSTGVTAAAPSISGAGSVVSLAPFPVGSFSSFSS